MKKVMIITGICGVFLTFAHGRDAPLLRTSQHQPSLEKVAPGTPEIAGKVKELLEIQKKMFDIERNVIQQDQELKQLVEQIRQLQQQLREKIEERLKDNEEYQTMKKRREQIRQEYRNVDFIKQDYWKRRDRR
ncbi:MAG: hypothetical protein NC931_00650 [Candidatus Omnitrophica bacterium]|nr:hypothetical protein [Candidatus Omnitrophota bacterium]